MSFPNQSFNDNIVIKMIGDEEIALGKKKRKN